jgi:uncharacterized membrane protein required for colicin V production
MASPDSVAMKPAPASVPPPGDGTQASAHNSRCLGNHHGMEQWITPSVVDVATIIFLLLGVVEGYRRRLSGEMAPALSTIVALALACGFFGPAARWLRAHSALSDPTARALAFSSVATAVFLVMLVLRSLFGKIMKVVIEDRTDRALGCLTGLVRTLAMAAIVFAVVIMTEHPYLSRKFGQESVIGRQVIRWCPALHAPLGPAPGSHGELRPGSEPAT